MVKLRQKSKRQPVRLRHKIQKASAAKQSKQRKIAKNNPQWKSRLKKDPGIPNLFPFKDKILQEIEDKKLLKAEELSRIRAETKQEKKRATSTLQSHATVNGDEDPTEIIDEKMEDDESNPMAAFLASAQAQAASFGDDNGASSSKLEEMDEDTDDDSGVPVPRTARQSAKATSYLHADSSRRTFDKVFKQILSAADIILYILDARDPSGTRSQEVEREIMAAESGSKRLILILNKCDLVPPAVLKGWLTYLRCYFPTIPLHVSTPASNASTFSHKHIPAKRPSEKLLHALKSYAQGQALGRSIAVGVIGYPNVGKSSVINSLISCVNHSTRSACPTGAEAGITTSIREVKLDNKLKLLDSPGIVFPVENTSLQKTEWQSRLILLNALPLKQISDPVPAVSLLLNRLSSSSTLYNKMLGMYGCNALTPSTDGDVTTDFLIQVARKRGRLGKGGVPNLSAAAMTVITDWRDGRVQGWTDPPPPPGSSGMNQDSYIAARNEHNEANIDQKKIVTKWAKEFKIEGLWGDGTIESNRDE